MHAFGASLAIIASSASPDILCSLSRVAKSLHKICMPLLYTDVVITREVRQLSYLLLLHINPDIALESIFALFEKLHVQHYQRRLFVARGC